MKNNCYICKTNNNEDAVVCSKCFAALIPNNKKKKEYPKTLYIKQVMKSVGQDRFFQQTINNKKQENEFRAQAASMEPNFTNEIQETPFPSTVK